VTARAVRLAAVGAAVAIAVYAGWDSALWDARIQMLLHAAAVGVVGAMVWVAWRGGKLPRTRIDSAIVALLVAYALATAGAEWIGLSAPALMGILLTVLMLPAALLALRHWPTLTALIAIVPVVGLALDALAVMAWRRLEWLLAGGAGAPPIRLAYEGTPFGSVAVPPFVILAVLPLALTLANRRARRWAVTALMAVGAPLAILSGSRSAWIAIGVAALVLAASSVRDLRGLVRGGRARLAMGALALAGGVGAFAFVAPRLSETTSLVYRTQLWSATLSVWERRKVFGIGPGAMPYAREAVAPLGQPHSHDVPLGILGDAGLVGVAAAVVLFATLLWVVRPRDGRSLAGRAAFAAIIGIGIGFLTEDLTFLPNFNLLVVLMVAVALREASAVRWQRFPRRPAARAVAGSAALAAVALVVVGLAFDASAIWYRAGTDASWAGDWSAATRSFRASTMLDPGQPMGHKSLAVAADRAGQPLLARRSAERAVALNPGDWQSWTNLSLLCLAEGDRACSLAAAERAVNASGRTGIALINAALVYEAWHQPANADSVYADALLANWHTALNVPWPRPVSPAVDRATASGPFLTQLALLVVRRQDGADLQPGTYPLASVRALAFAISGDRASAHAALADAAREAPADPFTWDVTALLLRHWGEDDREALRLGEVARGSPLSTALPATPPLGYDIASLRAYPADGLVRSAERLLGDAPWPWVLEPLLAP